MTDTSQWIQIGIDTGGTFTDLVAQTSDKNWYHAKVRSTPHNPAQAIFSGLKDLFQSIPKKITRDCKVNLIHGSTVATNAILERKGAKTCFITTQGFGDLLQLARQNRPDLYCFHSARPPSLVDPLDCYEVNERTLGDGSILHPIDETQVKKIAKILAHKKYESIAICLLHSYANPQHEQFLSQTLPYSFREHFLPEELDPSISISSEVAPVFREYERASTTVMNAYVQPLMSKYLHYLEHQVQKEIPHSNLSMMRSDGGQNPVDMARRKPIHTILSGPAGGVVAAKMIAKQSGFNKIISLDMGGTSTDVGLWTEDVQTKQRGSIGDLPFRMPTLDIHTVGAGGGSIVTLDRVGALRVGPESAGSDPGPMFLGKGSELTVTDFHVFLNHIDRETLKKRNIPIQMDKICAAIEQMAKKCSTSPVALSKEVLRTTHGHVENAIRKISTQKGYDLRDFILVSFGGAGPLHAVEVAKMMKISQVMIPLRPGLLSALGMIYADYKKVLELSIMKPSHQVTFEGLRKAATPLEEECIQELRKQGYDAGQTSLQIFLEMRYQGQSYELDVPLTPEFHQHFHHLHHIQLGHQDSEAPTEVVNLRIEATGLRPLPLPPTLENSSPHSREPDLQKSEHPLGIPSIHRDQLQPGHSWEGPCLVHEVTSTTLIPERCLGRVDDWGNLIITIPTSQSTKVSSGRFSS